MRLRAALAVAVLATIALGVPVSARPGATCAGERATLTGTGGRDTIRGTNGRDVIVGLGGDDVIRGRGGNDVICAGGGSDRVVAGAGDDWIIASTGSDRISGGGGKDKLDGASGNDSLIGGAGNDRLAAGAGQDQLAGGSGADRLGGGTGTDVVSFADHKSAVTADLDGTADDGSKGERDLVGSDVENLLGGAGPDRLEGNQALNRLEGGAGDDLLLGGTGADVFVGGGGRDTVSYADRAVAVTADLNGQADDGVASEGDLVGGDVEQLVGGSGGDILTGAAGDDTLTGGAGDDLLVGGGSADVMSGGPGVDTVSYADRAVAVTADLDGQADDGSANEGDLIGGDVEQLVGGSGDDSLTGAAGADILTGNAGNDLLSGGAGNDNILGNAGNDQLNGQPGDDTLLGGDGDDVLSGDEGLDTLDGGAGVNTCTRDGNEPAVPTCLYDTVKPKLESLSFSTTSLDLAGGQREMVATYRITDEVSGFKNGSSAFYFRGPNGQTVNGCISSTASSMGAGFSCRRVSGDDHDGIYQTQLTWPVNAAAGEWTLYWVYFNDAAGNATSLDENALAAAGLPTTITVANANEDTVKPKLESLSFSTTSLDLAGGQREMVATYRITDEVSGFKNGSSAFYFRGPNGQTVNGCISSTASSMGAGFSCRRVSGDDHDGIYQTQLTWPVNAAAGEWTLYWVYFNDAAGNATSLDKNALAAAGLPTTITVANANEDTVKPKLESLSFSTTSLDLAGGQREMVATYRITDEVSGFKNGSSAFYFRGPNGQTVNGCISSTASSMGAGFSCRRVSGDDHDGIYQTQLTWPVNAAAGEWTLYWVYFNDAAGNATSLDENALAAAGLPTTITVN